MRPGTQPTKHFPPTYASRTSTPFCKTISTNIDQHWKSIPTPSWNLYSTQHTPGD